MSPTPAKSKTLPILLSGGYNCSNRGDWALCSAALESLERSRLPHHTLVQLFAPIEDPPVEDQFETAVVMSRREQLWHRLGSLGSYRRYLALQRKSILRHLRETKDHFRRVAPGQQPILWFTGGGYMNDVASHGRFSTRMGLLAHDEGYRIVLTGQTIGPFRDSAFENDLRALLQVADWIGVRDDASLERVRAIDGLNVAPVRTHDNVFDMAPISWSRRQLQESLARLHVRLPERWVLMTFHQQNSTTIAPNARSIGEACRELQGAGVPVVVTSFWGYEHAADPAVASAVRNAGATWIDHRVNTPELRALAAQSELMVSTRLHGLIFAYAAGVPGVCLYAGQYYRDKALGLATDWGQDRWAIDTSTDYERLPELVLCAWQQRDEMVKALKQHADPHLGKLDPVFQQFQEWSNSDLPYPVGVTT